MTNQPDQPDHLITTIFLDIDGTILKHWGSLDNLMKNDTVVLDGVKEKFHEWSLKDYKIILTTGRRESMRDFTEKQLANNNIFYDTLIMGIGRGRRVIINDKKPLGLTDSVAIAINVDRNVGLEGLEV